MQSSGQQPTEKIGQHNGGVEDVNEQASSPLYEFPADNSLLQDTPLAQRDDILEQPSEELIQQGLIYPPPPAYYQNMQTPPVRPALPLQTGANASLTFHSSLPGLQAPLYPAGMQVPPYLPAQIPGMQPSAKKSYKWVWIVVSIFSAAFLVSCGLCGWAFYQLFNTTYQQESGAIDIVNNYFHHVQNQRYTIAYQDLLISGLTQDDYITKAQASDSQNGLLLSFVVERPTFATNPGSGPDLSQWRFTVDVTRANTAFPVLLTVQNVGGSWKITYIDRY
ncbi:MAG TPA: hypothetical protein VF844_13705 [Ktedonobacteraceae bacterium]